MGCDGGTIPRRDELVKVKKKPEQKDKVSELSFLWQHCNISQEPLRKPIVACGLGRLYNKDAVIQKLLDKSTSESVAHIKGLKDIKDLNLTPNPTFKPEVEKGGNQLDRQASPYICPISGLEMNGKFKFCFFWTCGCVMSERALKQFNEKVCAICQKPFTDEDIVIMNPADEDLELMNTRKEARQNIKKTSKKPKNKVEVPQNEEKAGEATKSHTGTIDKNKSTCLKIVKQEKHNISTKPPANKRSIEEMYDPAYKKIKPSYSVLKDPSSSQVYKSIFKSKDGNAEVKTPWITYNPFYN